MATSAVTYFHSPQQLARLRHDRRLLDRAVTLDRGVDFAMRWIIPIEKE
jgi:hypothetical protein